MLGEESRDVLAPIYRDLAELHAAPDAAIDAGPPGPRDANDGAQRMTFDRQLDLEVVPALQRVTAHQAETTDGEVRGPAIGEAGRGDRCEERYPRCDALHARLPWSIA